jgi:hypothetical protein
VVVLDRQLKDKMVDQVQVVEVKLQVQDNQVEVETLLQSVHHKVMMVD